ncbi:N-acetylmuramoyl-L-alanine amidase [Thermaerobacillus caldiproteolyticus]|uniref:N-acetylmuramoyl-L-alanine amidase n=1 Tax=Thermaerobacillus caldiproteolyticus TaxID=247480 RepID=UPI00188AEA46|nr:N-acetylmuramoyl-L-alanine amidase [Anoxybacillus caldiproteolyticus]QPA30734.1 N-acetylmuramoyl-L-alanine amidase [Anoxybacillus caldiproteolyticus]
MRLLCSFLVVLTLLFPSSLAAYAEEKQSLSSSDEGLLEIRDFNQSPPFADGSTSTTFTISSSNGTIFSDVPTDHWAKSEIEFLYQRSIIQGYTVNNGLQFRPNARVTRAQAAKMLMKALGEKEQPISRARFKDIPSDHWAAGWIERAVEKGIFQGYEDGTFRPDDPLKRSQMSKVIAIAFQLPAPPSTASKVAFTDVSSNYWAYPYISKLYYHGISNGNQNKFMPESYISRDQFSAFLARAMNEDFRLPVNSSVIATGKVTAQSLNVRSAGNANASIVGKLNYGTVVNVYEINGYWAKISYGKINGYVHKSYLKLKNVNGNPLQGRIITVDAGHGGTDSGAIGNGAYEKNIVLSVAKKLQQKLEKAGAKVIMTRANDTYKTLEERVQIAKNNYAELFVSIHVNSASASANGSETYYDTSTNPNGYESYLLAKEIQQQLVKNANMLDRGVKDNNFYVIRYNTVPSVLVELGFITNKSDVQKLTSDEYQNIFAESIYNGIVQYYNK